MADPPAASAFDESAVRALLNGSDEEVGRALAALDAHLRRRVCVRLSRRFPKLANEDIEDAWAETLRCALRAARGKRFHEDQALFPWIWRVAQRRAIDRSRRIASHNGRLAGFQLTVRHPEAADLRRERASAALEELLSGLMDTLPPRQQLVLRVFAERFPQSEDMELLRQEVSRAAGKEKSLGAVKRALQAARRKALSWRQTRSAPRAAG